MSRFLRNKNAKFSWAMITAASLLVGCGLMKSGESSSTAMQVYTLESLRSTILLNSSGFSLSSGESLDSILDAMVASNMEKLQGSVFENSSNQDAESRWNSIETGGASNWETGSGASGSSSNSSVGTNQSSNSGGANSSAERCVVPKGTALTLASLPQQQNRYYKVSLKSGFAGCELLTGYIPVDDVKVSSQSGAVAEAGASAASSMGGFSYPMDRSVPTCDEAGSGVGGFGAWRDGGARKHAGCDLYAPVGTKIYAIEDGVVQDSYWFYCSTDALEVKGTRTIRYGEIRSGSAAKYNVVPGSKVKKGQVIAEVGKLDCVTQSMLHLELFEGSASGPLTAGGIYKRRSDLLNPSSGLFMWRSQPLPR